MRLFAFFLCAVALAAKAQAQTEIYDVFPQSASETEAFIKKRFAPGTPIRDVERYLESQTFNCEPAKDPSFGDEDRKLKGQYDFCERVVPYGFQAGMRWQLAIIVEKNKFKDLHASYGIVGR